jgi:hypothetical protein
MPQEFWTRLTASVVRVKSQYNICYSTAQDGLLQGQGGRLDHHSKHKLVPTNQMDIIVAQAVNGTFELIHYDQLKDDNWKNASGKDKYIRRQTFDFTTKSLTVRLKANHMRSNISPNTLTDSAGHAFMMFP